MVIDSFVQMGPGVVNHRKRLVQPIEDTSTAEGVIAVMDRAGIDRSIAFAPKWVGGGIVDPTYEQGNRAIYEAARKYPQRIMGWARVNPNYGPVAVKELEKCLTEYGFKGLMLDPEWDNFHPSDRELVYPLIETAKAHRVPVMFNSWYCPSEPALFWEVANDFPEVPVVIAHLGGRLTVDAAFIAERAPNIYLETSDHMYRLGAFARRLGMHRILFGSNMPFTVPESEIYKVSVRKNLTEDEKQMILGGSAIKLFKLA